MTSIMERHPSPARIGGNFEELLNQEAIHDRSYIDMTPGFVTPTGTGYLYYIYTCSYDSSAYV